MYAESILSFKVDNNLITI